MDIKCKHCGSYLNIREVVARCTECGKELFNSNKLNMNPFKVKDTVHHIKYGKGTVIEVQNDTVLVAYDDESKWHSDLSLLSFTPYKLEGFTQERPFKPIVGNYYWFWTPAMLVNKAIGYGKFVGMKNGRYQFGNNEVEYCSENNPLECQ
jgi:hypothetical protein